jgi:hypothetical protein
MTFPIRPAITPEQALAHHREGNLGSALANLTFDEYEQTVLGFVTWLDTVKGYNPYHEAVVRVRWQELIEEFMDELMDELMELIDEGGDNEQE